METSAVGSWDVVMLTGRLVGVGEGRDAGARAREGVDDAGETVGIRITRAVGVTSASSL